MNREDVYRAIDGERDYQDAKWGSDKEQSLPGYLLIMRKEIEEAIDGWMKDTAHRNSALAEVLQVVAVGVKCLEVYGVSGGARPTNDITEQQMLEERMAASERRFGAR